VKPNMPGQRCAHAALLCGFRPDIFARDAAGPDAKRPRQGE
jgi:hypothetical protein